MANITIRNIPDDVFEKIKRLSSVEKRSVNNEMLVIIERGTNSEIEEKIKRKEYISKSIQIKLYYGSARSSAPAKNNSLIEEFLLAVEIIQADLPILKKFGELKNNLRNQGFLLSDADIFIAATTYEKADLLVSGNGKTLREFTNLNVENWIR